MTEASRKKAKETVDYAINYAKKGAKCAVDNAGETIALVTTSLVNGLLLNDFMTQLIAWRGFTDVMQECISKAEAAEKTAAGSLPKDSDIGS
jgi:hypothetical protein